MRRLLLLAVLLFSPSAFALDSNISVTVTAVDPVTTDIRFVFREPETKTTTINGATFHDVRVPGIPSFGNKSEPAIPTGRWLLDVTDQSIRSVELTGANWKNYPNILVSPSQGKQTLDGVIIPPSRPVYDSDTFLPSTQISMKPVGMLRKRRLVSVEVIPVRFNPKQKLLQFSRSMTVRITFQPKTGGHLATPVIKNPSHVETLLAGHVLNRPALATGPTPSKLLIIADDLYFDTPSSLLKDYINVRSREVTVNFFRISQTGKTADAIHDFLLQQYADPDSRPDYVLFVGNHDQVPGYEQKDPFGTTYVSDYRHALLSGGPDDRVPDVMIGRYPSDTVDELNKMIGRSMRYLQPKFMPDGPWLGRAALFSFSELPSIMNLSTAFKSIRTLSPNAIWYQDNDSDLTRQNNHPNMRKETSEGLTFLMYFGHGGGTYWLNFADGTFTTKDVEPLGTTVHTPFVLDMSCSDAKYEQQEKTMGEQWMLSGPLGGPRGAIAYVGSSGKILTKAAGEFAIGFTAGMFDAGHKAFGKAMLDGYLEVIPSTVAGSYVTTEDNDSWNAMKMLHLFGDPSLSIRAQKAVRMGSRQRYCRSTMVCE